LKFILSAILGILISSQAFSQYSSPESITYDTVSNRYFISNTSSSKILQRDRQGIVTDFVTVGGSIHGVTVHNNRVYVCNGTRIRGYDLTTALEVFNVVITGSVFLNDLAAGANEVLYVTDFNGRRIYKLNTITQEFWIYVANTTNTPNGIYVDIPRNRLLICCWGGSAPIRSVNLADSSITTVANTSYSNCDGISLDKFDNVYVSTWGIQSVVKFDINFANPPTVVTGSLSNPADIYVNRKTDTLAIPNAGNSTVTFFFLNNPSSINQSNEIPDDFTLYQNFPNPFNPNTVIGYNLAVSSFISIKVYDILGNEVASLVNEKQSSGYYEIDFYGIGLNSGIYYYRLESGETISEAKKMILLK